MMSRSGIIPPHRNAYPTLAFIADHPTASLAPDAAKRTWIGLFVAGVAGKRLRQVDKRPSVFVFGWKLRVCHLPTPLENSLTASAHGTAPGIVPQPQSATRSCIAAQRCLMCEASRSSCHGRGGGVMMVMPRGVHGVMRFPLMINSPPPKSAPPHRGSSGLT